VWSVELDVAWGKVLDFVKVDYAKLFILAAKSKDEYSRIIQSRRTTQVSCDS